MLKVVRFTAYRDPSSARCPAAIFYAMQLTNILVIFSSATDFVVYYICRRRFRNILREWFRRHIVRCLPGWVRDRQPSTTSESLIGARSASRSGDAVKDRQLYRDIELADTTSVEVISPRREDERIVESST